jgi:hypothetical protein
MGQQACPQAGRHRNLASPALVVVTRRATRWLWKSAKNSTNLRRLQCRRLSSRQPIAAAGGALLLVQQAPADIGRHPNRRASNGLWDHLDRHTLDHHDHDGWVTQSEIAVKSGG